MHSIYAGFQTIINKMTTSHKDVIDALKLAAIPKNIPLLQRFFKTKTGEYGEGDIFMGVKVPAQRQIAKTIYKDITLSEISLLLQQPYHECRLTAAIILTLQFEHNKKDIHAQKAIVNCYLQHKAYINNWDIVDSSAPKILGPYVHQNQDWQLLHALSQEESIWSKRIAIVTLLYLFKQGYHHEGLQLLLANLQHPHDLLHKANGWMLRELGKYNQELMIAFLQEHYPCLPRTTLRYAIEKLDNTQRKELLEGKF